MGFCQLVMVNPHGMVPVRSRPFSIFLRSSQAIADLLKPLLPPLLRLQDLVYLCNAICKWTTPTAELNEVFRKVLTSFKEMLGEAWSANFPTFPPALQERLRSRYQL
jgi:hypothetical protein